MAGRETGKQKAARIPLDYYKRPDRLERWKNVLALAALVIAAGWAASSFVRGPDGQKVFSRGPVAKVHAMWDDKCTACHVPFRPIRDDTAGQLLGVASMSTRCQSCHAGPIHNHKQKTTPSCASCHREHQGRRNSLVDVSDRSCTQCHSALQHHMHGTPQFIPKITSFATDHPNFRIIERKGKDPGKLKFNHFSHMWPGLKTRGRRDKYVEASFKLGQIDAKYRDFYRRQQPSGKKSDDDLVQLNCSSCHTLDTGDQPAIDHRHALKPPSRAAGAYMLPINYEAHCQACHALTFAAAGAGTSKRVTIPHGMKLTDVRTFLKGYFLDQAVSATPAFFTKEYSVKQPLPGKNLQQQAARQVKNFLDSQIDRTMKLVNSEQTCWECHHKQDGKVVPPAIPDVWFRHAKFDHVKHRAVSCKSCHPQAYTDWPDQQCCNETRQIALRQSSTAETVMLPDINNCKTCHYPKTTTRDGRTLGGASFKCTECHSYHHRSDPALQLQGIGASSRDPQRRLRMERLLTTGSGE